MRGPVYVAGPMRGLPYYNFPAFDAAAAKLRAEGLEVVSPADLDRAIGFDPWSLPRGWDWAEMPPGFDLDACIARDLRALHDCHTIYMLRGWEKSTGANAEFWHAKWRGLQVAYEEQGEEIVTDPQTGGQKGSKLARFDLIPSRPLWLLAEHYGRGARKYDDRNWERGYRWGLSFAALQRHLWAWWGGEDVDAETGGGHLVAAAWHAFTLMEFAEKHPDKDDRPNVVGQ